MNKSIIFALAMSSFSFGSLASAFPNGLDHNHEPINQSSTSINKMDLNMSNYRDVLKSKVGGVYSNPFGVKKDILISFNLYEPEGFFSEIDGVDFEKSMNTYISSYSDHQSFSVHKDKKYNLLRMVVDDKSYNKLKDRWSNRDYLTDKFEEFVFLHEVFHDANSDFQGSTREALSDVAAVIAISITHNYSHEELYDLAKDVYLARSRDANKKMTSHFGKDELLNFLNYIDDMEDRNEKFDLKSFVEIHKKTLEVTGVSLEQSNGFG